MSAGGVVLDAQNWQGWFAENYVRALASAAGLLVHRPEPDHDGVDLGFRVPDRLGRVSFPQLEAQIKSWSAPRRTDSALHFRGLTEVQFNRLAGRDYQVRRYLFVVLVPKEPARYASFATDGMTLRQLAYFRCLEDERRFDDPRHDRKPLVQVPLGNVLTVRSLQELLRREAESWDTPA